MTVPWVFWTKDFAKEETGELRIEVKWTTTDGSSVMTEVLRPRER